MTEGLLRFARFNAVSVMGIGVQLATVAALVHGFGAGAVTATALGVTAAVLHNFVWHVRWTWRDRMGSGASKPRAFLRFLLANGAVSFVGSIAMMPGLAGPIGLDPVLANLVTIAACGLINFGLAQRFCFRVEAPAAR